MERNLSITTTGFRLVCACIISSFFDANVIKIIVKLNDNFLKTTQFTVVGINMQITNLIVPIVTTKACQVTLYWSGPSAAFFVFTPTKSLDMNYNFYQF
jgi:hypothetical protein